MSFASAIGLKEYIDGEEIMRALVLLIRAFIIG